MGSHGIKQDHSRRSNRYTSLQDDWTDCERDLMRSLGHDPAKLERSKVQEAVRCFAERRSLHYVWNKRKLVALNTARKIRVLFLAGDLNWLLKETDQGPSRDEAPSQTPDLERRPGDPSRFRRSSKAGSNRSQFFHEEDLTQSIGIPEHTCANKRLCYLVSQERYQIGVAVACLINAKVKTYCVEAVHLLTDRNVRINLDQLSQIAKSWGVKRSHTAASTPWRMRDTLAELGVETNEVPWDEAYAGVYSQRGRYDTFRLLLAEGVLHLVRDNSLVPALQSIERPTDEDEFSSTETATASTLVADSAVLAVTELLRPHPLITGTLGFSDGSGQYLGSVPQE
jgi:hypothetical protein